MRTKQNTQEKDNRWVKSGRRINWRSYSIVYEDEIITQEHGRKEVKRERMEYVGLFIRFRKIHYTKLQIIRNSSKV